jgi:hypothetical protein
MRRRRSFDPQGMSGKSLTREDRRLIAEDRQEVVRQEAAEKKAASNNVVMLDDFREEPN